MFIAIGLPFFQTSSGRRNVPLLTELKRFMSKPGYKHCALTALKSHFSVI
jgi:hypothetical protein